MSTAIKALHCTICQKPLTGLQRKFCSSSCKARSGNSKHQNYKAQRARGALRKLFFILQHGGKCEACGYEENLAALVFHHKKPENKAIHLDLRTMSNATFKKLLAESEKCELLCMNCHQEKHHPGFTVSSAEEKFRKELHHLGLSDSKY